MKERKRRDPAAYKMSYHGAHNHSNLQAICCVAMGTVISPERARENERREREAASFVLTARHMMQQRPIYLSL